MSESQASAGAARPQRVRIQVGISASQSAQDERPVPTAAETAAAAAAAAATALPYAATTKLFDLCDSSYMTKKVKRTKKGKQGEGAGTGEVGAGAGAAGGGAAAAAPSGRKTLSSVAAAAAAASALAPNSRRRGQQDEEARSSSGPRVEFVNGNIVLKESSLVLPDNVADEEFEEQEEGLHSTATYFSFLKRKQGSKWGFEETWLYYKALRQCGTEFSLMQSFFPGRTRKQLKLKYIKEEREHPELIRRTLDHSIPLELAPFRAQFGQLRTAGKAAAKAAAEMEVFVPVGAAAGGGQKRKADALAPPAPGPFNPAEDSEDDLFDV